MKRRDFCRSIGPFAIAGLIPKVSFVCTDSPTTESIKQITLTADLLKYNVFDEAIAGWSVQQNRFVRMSELSNEDFFRYIHYVLLNLVDTTVSAPTEHGTLIVHGIIHVPLKCEEPRVHKTLQNITIKN